MTLTISYFAWVREQMGVAVGFDGNRRMERTVRDQVRDLAQSVRDATCSGALSPWKLPGEVPVAVPGLGFRAQGLFGGASAPPWTTTAAR